MAGYVFDYNRYMDEMVSLTDSLNLMALQTKNKIECIRGLCRRIKTSFQDQNPWTGFVKQVDNAYKNRDFGLSPIEYIQMNYVKEIPLLTNKTDFFDRKDVLSGFMSLAEEFVRTTFSEYRYLFASDKDFIDLFLNENGFDEAKLVGIVNMKFRGFISNLGDGQALKGSDDSPLGKEMIKYCNLGYFEEKRSHMEFFEFLPSVSQTIEQLLADYVSQNRPLEKAKNRYNGSYRNFMRAYINGR